MGLSHFLVTNHDIDGDAVYGIFDSFVAARDETERLIDEDNARPNRVNYGIHEADIEEWMGLKPTRRWTRTNPYGVHIWIEGPGW